MIDRLIGIFIFLGFTANITHAQFSTHRDSIRTYYLFTNKAELAIVDSLYDKALLYYVSANKYKWLNADDLYNAEIVAYLAKDTIRSVYFLNTLAIYGLKKSAFEAKQWGSKVRNDAFYKYISIGYDSIYNESAINNPMAFYGQKMIPFMDKDRHISVEVKDKNGKSIGHIHQNPSRASSDHENALAMLSYVKEFGFPSFRQTGFYDTMKIGDQSGTYWYLWWHRCPDSTLKEVTLNAVLDGEFPPDDYALSIDVCRPVGGKITYYSIPDRLFTKEQIQDINEERDKIYLEPLADYIKKLEYYEKDMQFYLLNNLVFGLYKISVPQKHK